MRIKKLTFSFFVSICVVLAAILWSTPLAVRYFMVDWLKQNGVDSVVISDIDVNYFSGEFSMQDVRLKRAGQPTLSLGRLYINVSLQALLDQQLLLQQVVLANTSLRMEQTGTRFRVAGLLPAKTRQPQGDIEPRPSLSDWGIGVQRIDIYNTGVVYAGKDYESRLNIQHLSLRDLLSWQMLTPVQARADLLLDDAPIFLQASGTPFDEQPEILFKLQAQDFELSALTPLLSAQGIQHLAAKVDIDQDVQVLLKPDSAIQLTLDGDLHVRDIQLTAGENWLQQKELHWLGRIDVGREDDQWNSRVAGSLEARGAEGGNADYRLSNENMRVDLDYQRRLTEAAPQTNLQAGVLAGATALHKRDGSIKLLAAQQWDVKGVHLEANKGWSIRAAEFADIEALRGFDRELDKTQSTALLHLGRLGLQGIHLAEASPVEIDLLELHQLQGRFLRKNDGSFAILQRLQNGPAQQPQDKNAPQSKDKQNADGATAAKQGTPAVKLSRLVVGGDNRLQFSDHYVSPPYEAHISPLSLRLENLDSANPESKARLTFSATLNDYTQLSLQGSMQPFADKLSTDMQGNINALDLPPLSAYTEKFLGYSLKRGQLDADMVIRIDHDRLLVDNNLNIRHLTLTARDTREGKAFTDHLAMPLDKTLDLLRDKKGHIKIEVPVRGDLADPQFQLSDVINQATTSALKFGAIQYLKYTLQPWGTMLSVAEFVGGKMKPRFEPVAFLPGKVVVEKSSQAYLNKLASVLRERPALSMTLCGIAATADREWQIKRFVEQEQFEEDELRGPALSREAQTRLDNALKQLANARAQWIKEHFVQEYAIAAKRLFICQPEVRLEAGQKPAVEVSL